MKTCYKVIAIIAGCALGLGLVLSIVGVCIGGTAAAAQSLVNHSRLPFLWRDGREDAGGWEVSGDPNDWVKYEFKNDREDEEYLDSELGSVENNMKGKITELEWDIDFGKVTVKTGSGYSMTGKNIYKAGFESYVEDGTWYITYKQKNSFKVGWDWESGLDVDASWFPKSELVITVPEDTIFDEAWIELGAGDAKISGLTVREAEINVGAGTAEADGFEILDGGYITVGMGNMVLKNFYGNKMSFDCGMGSINAEGEMSGDTELSCGIGEITMVLDAAEEDYDYYLDCGLGSVKIGKSKSYSAVDKEIDYGAGQQMDVECGIGKVVVSFTK